jgi:HlyD family secretion protein
MRKLWILAPVVLLLVGTAVSFAMRTLGDAPEESTLLVSGNIESHESVVSFQQVQARIVDLPFDEGQFVEAGTPLARVDDSTYRQQVAVNESIVAVQQDQLDSARERLNAARAAILNDQAQLSQVKLDRDRAQQLFDEHAIARSSLDHAETAHAQASAALMRDQAMLRVTEKDIIVAEATARNAGENLKMAQIALDNTILHAPFSGVILTRQTELGEVLPPGAPALTLADLEHVWLRAYINETDLGKIRLGQPASVMIDTYPGKEYHGRISFISSRAEFTPKSVETHKERVTLVYRIKIDLENSGHELKPGMPADASIPAAGKTATKTSTLLVPHQ